jgi:hypothetical protein
MERVADLIDNINDETNGAAPLLVNGDISFESVCVQYPGSSAGIDQFTTTIQRSSVVRLEHRARETNAIN